MLNRPEYNPSTFQGNILSALKGKTALITGAARRIGRATALGLAERGARIIVHFRESKEEAEVLASEIRGLRTQAWIIQADLAEPDQATGLFERAMRLAGPIDLLINNASIFPRHTLADITAADLALNVQVNAWAPFVLGRALADLKREGCIVNFVDTRISHYDRLHAAYHLSKRMLFTLTRMMAMEFAPRVRVNAVAPGLVLPPPGEDDTYLQKMVPGIPLQRAGSLQTVTDAVLFLLTNDFITGQVIFVDGGFHMKGSMYGG
jgi:hypothetical protein